MQGADATRATLIAAAMLLVACGGNDADDAAAAPSDPTPDHTGSDDLDDLDDLDPDAALDAVSEQLEELGEAMEEAVEAPEQDDDQPLLTPADITLTGSFEGTYTDVPGCDTYEQEGGSHDLRILLAGAGKSFDWTGGAPDEAGGGVSAAINVGGFTGSGTYSAVFDMGRVDQVATGTIQVTIEELRREEFPTGEIVVFSATVDGDYQTADGSGQISGSTGVCNARIS